MAGRRGRGPNKLREAGDLAESAPSTLTTRSCNFVVTRRSISSDSDGRCAALHHRAVARRGAPQRERCLPD